MKIVKLIALTICIGGGISLYAQNATIDWSFQPGAKDVSKSFFNWSMGDKKMTDTVDSTTGASKNKSTSAFNLVRTENGQANGKKAIPAGLRSLMLYPLSKDTYLVDNLTFTPAGKEFVIRFVHRDIAYEITTIGGKIDLQKSFKIAASVCTNNNNKFEIKQEFLKVGGDPKDMKSLDWTKIKLTADTSDPTSSRWYEGTLAFTGTDKVYTVKGTLTEKKK